MSNSHEWVRISFDEIENETGLSRTEQEQARSKLIKQSLLKERLVSTQGDILEFWPDIEALEEKLSIVWEEAKNVALKTNSQLASQQKRADELILKNNTKLYSQKTRELIVEDVTPGKLEKKDSIDSEDSLASRDNSTLLPKHPYIEGNSSSTNLSNVATENSYASTSIVKADKFFPVQRQPISVKVIPNYQFSGPWESTEQFENFQRALLAYFKNKGVEHPAGWVFRIVDGMTKGLLSPFWDEFVSGIPLGETQKVKRDWEIETGVPYPAFEEERIQYYVHKGELLEVAVSKARSDLRDPVLGKDLWDGFLRKCDRIADEALKAQKLGVAAPYLPSSFTDRPQITKQSVINKLAAVAPQFSLSTSSLESLTEGQLKPPEIEDKPQSLVCDVPTLSSLQDTYNIPMGRTMVERQIAEHPEWGYGIVNGQVIDLIPF